MKYPYKIGELSITQSKNIKNILDSMGRDISLSIKNIKREKDIQRLRSEINFHVSEGVNLVGLEIYKTVVEGRRISIEGDIAKFSKTILPKVAYDEFKEYMEASRGLINISVDDYLTKKSLIDGTSMKYKLKTIKDGASDVVEAIIRNGIREGKGAFEIGKDIEKYIVKDARGRFISPYTIKKRELGLPVSRRLPDSIDIPAGSVDFNALRIARTELINNYRWARLDATKGKDWVIGWAWRLSQAHPKPDECDVWASHNEGLGEGVYSKASDVSSLGHPHCFCQLETITIFDKQFAKYFAKAEASGLISPRKYGVPVVKA